MPKYIHDKAHFNTNLAAGLRVILFESCLSLKALESFFSEGDLPVRSFQNKPGPVPLHEPWLTSSSSDSNWARKPTSVSAAAEEEEEDLPCLASPLQHTWSAERRLLHCYAFSVTMPYDI